MADNAVCLYTGLTLVTLQVLSTGNRTSDQYNNIWDFQQNQLCGDADGGRCDKVYSVWSHKSYISMTVTLCYLSPTNSCPNIKTVF